MTSRRRVALWGGSAEPGEGRRDAIFGGGSSGAGAGGARGGGCEEEPRETARAGG